MRLKIYLFILLTLFLIEEIKPQQIADTTYHPEIKNPAYQVGKGPVVFIDEGHYNFHTKNGRYKPFAMLLERDGYNVKEFKGKFEMSKLNEGKILVISNALNKINDTNWVLPTPSAFTKEEIKTVADWVSAGGSLFLIADHMPLAGAAHDLAAVFGFEIYNGFAFDTTSNNRGQAFFNRNDLTLTKSPLTDGRNSSEKINQVVSFTGQAFKIPADAQPVLIFNQNFEIFLPDTAWQFNDKTKRISVEGWSQGAYKKFGKGRIAIFGEVAMFSAQLGGEQKVRMGMNSEIASENYQFLLNIIHWLDRKLN